jgi:hypothetical protein
MQSPGGLFDGKCAWKTAVLKNTGQFQPKPAQDRKASTAFADELVAGKNEVIMETRAISQRQSVHSAKPGAAFAALLDSPNPVCASAGKLYESARFLCL